MTQLTDDAPLDWSRLVATALRRRRAEGLTQKAHALRAGVSVPTMIAFDHGETTLSLTKAMAILRVVGLVVDHPPEDPQDTFVAAAQARWAGLVEALPETAPARQNWGHYAFDTEIVGPLVRIGPQPLMVLLPRAVVRTGPAPPFWVPPHEAATVVATGGVVECWRGRPVAAHPGGLGTADFWRCAPQGRLYLRRGYAEDAAELLEPGTILDLTLPIWRAGESLLHAARLAWLLAEGAETDLRFRAVFTGLAGRALVSWANPLRRPAPGQWRCAQPQAALCLEVPAAVVETELASLLYELLRPLYERFDGFALAPALVEEVVADLHRMRGDHGP